MANVALPDVSDLDGVIGDYLDALFPGMECAGHRERIIERCVEPFSKLVATWECIGTRGAIETQVWRAFMRDLLLMADSRSFGEIEESEMRHAICARTESVHAKFDLDAGVKIAKRSVLQ